jgi:hypothetical protein
MSAPTYLGDTDWKRQAGGSFGFTKDGLQFRDLVYRGRLDSADSFIAQFPKGTSSPLPGEGHLNLTSAPVVRDENGVSGSATLRFEGVSGTNPEGDENEQWFNETKEVLLIPTLSQNKIVSPQKYSYISPQVVYTYKDNQRRDLLSEANRFKNPYPFGSGKAYNNKEDRYYKITQPQFLVEFVEGQNPVSVEALLDINKAERKWNVKQVSGFQTITKDASDIYTHIEQHFLILEAINQDG